MRLHLALAPVDSGPAYRRNNEANGLLLQHAALQVERQLEPAENWQLVSVDYFTSISGTGLLVNSIDVRLRSKTAYA